MRLKSDLFEALEAVVDERLDTVDLRVGPAPRGDRGHGLRGLSRPLRARSSDPTTSTSRQHARRQGLPRRHHPPHRPGQRTRAARRHRRRPRARTSPPWAPPWPRHATAPTRPSAPSASRAVTIAATSPSRSRRVRYRHRTRPGGDRLPTDRVHRPSVLRVHAPSYHA